MKQLLALLLFFACSCSHQQYHPAENDLDAGREFIDATLKGDFDKADFYLYHDNQNINFFNAYKAAYTKKNNENKKQLHDATITILEIKTLNDKETIIFFRNSFDKVSRQIKVSLQNNMWQVDLKSSSNF
jgi:hypothetical protein